MTNVKAAAAASSDVAGTPVLAVDTESDGFHRYPERVCLVQIGLPGRVYLLDPLAVDEMPWLGLVLENPDVVKIVHAADYDLRVLDREWGYHVNNLFDTAVAASFVGIRQTGLGSVLESILDITIPKDRKLQRSDWSLRPLSPAAIEYAASDVEYLLPLRKSLGDRLEHLGRTGWVAEECKRLTRVRYVPPDREGSFLTMKGSRSLDARGLAVLKSLVAFREGEAVRLRRPHFRVISDPILIQVATAPTAALYDIRGLGPYRNGRLARELRKAVDTGVKGPPVHRPPRTTPRRPIPSVIERKRLKDLKEWRSRLGEQLDLDPALLWPAASLERLARSPVDMDAELTGADVRDWQRREFGESLRATLR